MTSFKAVIASFFLLFVGCAKRPADSWPHQVSRALAGASASLSENERAEYEAGFTDGAAMVHEALKAGERPYRPVLQIPVSAPPKRGVAPEATQAEGFTFSSEDVRVEASAFVSEVDTETGLLIFPASDVKSPAFGRGQVEGFSWALSTIGRSLVHPVPPLALPTTWEPFTKTQGGQDLDAGKKTVRLLWAPGHLGWAWKERGFPGHRTWRIWNEAEAPRWIGLTEQAIWVESRDGQAIALDLVSGGILRFQPAVIHMPAKGNDLETYEQNVLKELNSPAFQHELADLRKVAESGAIPDLMAVAERLHGMGDQADREAFAWYLKAAEKGSPEAMLQVGTLLFHGKSVPADKVAAKAWLERATEAGQPDASAVIKMLWQGSE